jgi:hypothetical protein
MNAICLLLFVVGAVVFCFGPIVPNPDLKPSGLVVEIVGIGLVCVGIAVKLWELML